MTAILVSLGLAAVGLSSCSHVPERERPAGPAQPAPAAQRLPAPFAWPAGIRAAVSLSFDDARESQLDFGLPIFDAASIKATFYVSFASLKKRLPDWEAALKAGHEIGNHSVRHACTANFPFAKGRALEDYTLPQMEAELDEASAEIQMLLGVQPLTFAYPCGQKYVGRGRNVRSYVPAVAARYLAGRGWRDEAANDPALCDPAQLMCMELDGLTWEELRVLVEQAQKNGSWLVLCGHDIREEGRQTTRTDTLRSFCEYARDPKNGLWVDTVANVARYVVEQRTAAPRR
jgi:peptidoglycan/xylan/chitin deacetylase (PgdA/CDA1 family)